MPSQSLLFDYVLVILIIIRSECDWRQDLNYLNAFQPPRYSLVQEPAERGLGDFILNRIIFLMRIDRGSILPQEVLLLDLILWRVVDVCRCAGGTSASVLPEVEVESLHADTNKHHACKDNSNDCNHHNNKLLRGNFVKAPHPGFAH